jgi:hypothetical protein
VNLVILDDEPDVEVLFRQALAALPWSLRNSAPAALQRITDAAGRHQYAGHEWS